MNETEVEIADPEEPSSEGSYENLWVPLVIVPAGIVLSILLVVALFGGLSGSESTMAENLELVVRGGSNSRDQALFNLARQAAENQAALASGEELPWEVESGFASRVRQAAQDVDADDHEARLALGVLLTSLGDDEGLQILLTALELTDEQDPGRMIRFSALQNVALLGDERATPAVLVFLDHDDEGLRNLAATALGALAGDGAREALRGALDDASLGVRATAAVSLTKLDPPDEAAAPVLRELLDPEVYAAENARDAQKYRQEGLVSAIRVRAIRALATLGLAEDRERFEVLESDPDLAVREACMRALAGGDGR